MKGYRGYVAGATATLGAGVVSFMTHFAFAADAQPQLRLIATRLSARAVVVKLDNDKPVLWRQGETLAIAKQMLRLLQCTHDHAVAEIIGAAGASATHVVLLSVGQSYLADEALIPPAESLAIPIATGIKPR